MLIQLIEMRLEAIKLPNMETYSNLPLGLPVSVLLIRLHGGVKLPQQGSASMMCLRRKLSQKSMISQTFRDHPVPTAIYTAEFFGIYSAPPRPKESLSVLRHALLPLRTSDAWSLDAFRVLDISWLITAHQDVFFSCGQCLSP